MRRALLRACELRSYRSAHSVGGVGDERKCPVCLEKFKEDTQIVFMADCEHFVCENCYHQLKSNKYTECIMCRKPMKRVPTFSTWKDYLKAVQDEFPIPSITTLCRGLQYEMNENYKRILIYMQDHMLGVYKKFQLVAERILERLKNDYALKQRVDESRKKRKIESNLTRIIADMINSSIDILYSNGAVTVRFVLLVSNLPEPDSTVKRLEGRLKKMLPVQTVDGSLSEVMSLPLADAKVDYKLFEDTLIFDGRPVDEKSELMQWIQENYQQQATQTEIYNFLERNGTRYETDGWQHAKSDIADVFNRRNDTRFNTSGWEDLTMHKNLTGGPSS